MAFIPIPNSAKLALEFVIAGVPVVVTIGITRADAPSVPNMTQAGLATLNWWAAHLRPLQANACVLEGARVTDQSTQFGPEVFVPRGAPNTGQVAGEVAPNNVSCFINFLTALRGKAHRGGNFVPGIPEVMPDSGTTLPATYVASLLTAYGALEAFLSNEGWTQSVLSRQLNGAPRVVGVATDVIGYAADTTIDDIGRRLR